MARTKRTIRRSSPHFKRAKSAGGSEIGVLLFLLPGPYFLTSSLGPLSLTLFFPDGAESPFFLFQVSFASRDLAIATPGPDRRTGPGTSQSGGIGVGVGRSSSPSQQPPRGCCSAGSGFEEGPIRLHSEFPRPKSNTPNLG
ncbi:hypothetical protein LIER_03019 [Lithospermum erythrorhizon]|uniref:Uncharacterized protein n=1 Tax=Lithospermum erythrorhizon TaxID=34254 RepID=A0AAV3NSW0_LITER